MLKPRTSNFFQLPCCVTKCFELFSHISTNNMIALQLRLQSRAMISGKNRVGISAVRLYDDVMKKVDILGLIFKFL